MATRQPGGAAGHSGNIGSPLEDTSDKSWAELDAEYIAEYNRAIKDRLERQKWGEQRFDWRGNSLPPMRIEPMPYQRNRMVKTMTAEERALRKQWVMDQRLAPHEPIYIPALQPRHVFRRMIGWPWDKIALGLHKTFGHTTAYVFRKWYPKAAGFLLFTWFGWYHLKYSMKSWETAGGGWWIRYKRRGDFYTPDAQIPVYPHHHWYDNGFVDRKAFKKDALY